MACGFFQHRGLSFPGLLYSPRGLEAAREFPVEDDDVFNVTYQKSGTVWMLEILSLIRQDGDPGWCRSVPNWDRGPWLETLLGYKRAKSNARPRIISSHLPVHMFPKAFFGSKAKVIYTVRDPKDVLVSLFHFARIFRPYKDPGSLEEFMEKFLEGDVPFGSWFQHVRGWLQLRGQDNFFWISYEELQQDLRGSVQRLCSFLGHPLDEVALDMVVANASFVTMSHNPMSNFSLSPRFILDRQRGPFLRKGISGDWRNHLSPEQSRRFDLVYRERMEGLGVSFPWEPQNRGEITQNSSQEPQNYHQDTPKYQETQNWGEMTPKNHQEPQNNSQEPQKYQETQNRGEITQNNTQEPQNCHQETQKYQETQNRGEMTQNNTQEPQNCHQETQKYQETQNRGEMTQNNTQEPQNYHQETQKYNQEPQKYNQEPQKYQETQKGEEMTQNNNQEPQNCHQETQKYQETQKGGEMTQNNSQEPQKYNQETQNNSQEPQKNHQEPQKGGEMTQKSPQNPPKRTKKKIHDPPKTTQDPPKSTQKIPQDPQKNTQKSPHDPPKTTPKNPQEPQKGGEMPQKTPQEPQKTPQDTPKTTQDPPKT